MTQAQLKTGLPIQHTLLPNNFIDHYLSVVNAVYALVYIVYYRQLAAGNQSLTLKLAADALGIREADVLGGLSYWQNEGLMLFELAEGGQLSISFLPVEAKEDAAAEIPAVPAQKSESRALVLMETRPVYTPEELDLYKRESQEAKRLFLAAEKTLGKLLTYQDMSVLFSLYDWLRLPADVIALLLETCEQNGHRSIRYIEKTALDWAENGVFDLEAAKAYLNLFNHDYREIMKACGLSGRNPSPSEVKYMKKWLLELKLPLDVITEACDKTVLQISKPRFSYIDKILSKWHDEGVRSVADAARLEDARAKENEAKPSSAAAPKKSGRFVNFKQREWQPDQISKLESRYLSDAGLDKNAQNH